MGGEDECLAMAVPAGTGHSLRDLPGSCQLLDTLWRVFQLGDATLAYTSRTPWFARDCLGGYCKGEQKVKGTDKQGKEVRKSPLK